MSGPGYEADRRRRKADALVGVLGGRGVTATQALELSAVERAEACSAAGIRPASPETWALVVALLSDTEAIARQEAALRQPADPLDGLPRGPRDR